jgi:hypothetical protein
MKLPSASLFLIVRSVASQARRYAQTGAHRDEHAGRSSLRSRARGGRRARPVRRLPGGRPLRRGSAGAAPREARDVMISNVDNDTPSCGLVDRKVRHPAGMISST